ncbi:TPA: DHHA1 domain-containing protein, partial [Campylobacter jejuni]
NEILSLKNELKNSSKTELDSKNIQGVEICVKRIDNGDIKAMIDDFKNKFAKAVILLIQVKDEKITLAAGVKDVPLKAGALVKEAAQILGGNGGGRDDFATAGGKDLSKINEALKQSLETIEKAL